MSFVPSPSFSAEGRAPRRRLRILTWHVHGNYLYALTQLPHDFIIPIMPDNRPDYAALGPNIPWGDNVYQVPVHQLKEQALDCVIYQSRRVFESDAQALLSASQLALPCAYIEHNPPEPHPTDTEHFFHHNHGVLVHVTAYNALMWCSPSTRTHIVEHGVKIPAGVQYSGHIACGISVINHLKRRGRRVGADVYEVTRAQLPLDLIGMDSEAMMVGLPVVGIAATELPTVITNGVNGYVDTKPERLVDCMRQLLDEPQLAQAWGAAARETALRRFGIDRYLREWEQVLASLDGGSNE